MNVEKVPSKRYFEHYVIIDAHGNKYNAIKFAKIDEAFVLSFENAVGINFEEGVFKNMKDVKQYVKKEEIEIRG